MIDWREEVKKALSKNYEVALMWGLTDEDYQIEIIHKEKATFSYYKSCIHGLEKREELKLREVHTRIDKMDDPHWIYINGEELVHPIYYHPNPA